MLRDDPEILAITGADRENSKELVQRLYHTPDGTAARNDLRAYIAKLDAAYTRVVGRRITAPGFVRLCAAVVAAGDGSFIDVYDSVWAFVLKSDPTGIEEYRKMTRRGKEEAAANAVKYGCCNASDLDVLYTVAAKWKGSFDSLVRKLVGRYNAKHPDNKAELKVPPDLKDVTRATEKARLRHANPGDASGILDVVRVMCVVKTMGAVAVLYEMILREPRLKVNRQKCRFLEECSSGHWRDLMVGIPLLSHARLSAFPLLFDRGECSYARCTMLS